MIRCQRISRIAVRASGAHATSTMPVDRSTPIEDFNHARVWAALPRRLWRIALALFVIACLPARGGYAQQTKGVAKRKKPAVVPIQRDMRLAKQLSTPSVQPVSVIGGCGVPVELDLSKGRCSYPNASQIDPTVPPVFDMLCYNGRPVGPTIRIKRGRKLMIRLRNQLHGPVDPGPDPLDAGNPWEVPHGLCSTNLHTHGLHVSPSGNGDNVFQHIEPGKALDYEYEIPADHPSGTFWYHPHKHGSVAYQLSNGVAVALHYRGKPR